MSLNVVVQLLSHLWLFETLWTTALKASLSFTISWSFSNLCPLSWSYYLTISFSAALSSSCLHSFPSSGSFPVNWIFESGGQNIGASASVLPMNIQGWLPLRLTGLISLLSEGLSRSFSSTTVWNHQIFGTEPTLWSNSHICTWLLEKL